MARPTPYNLNRREFLTVAGAWKAKDPRSGLSDWLANISVRLNRIKTNPIDDIFINI